jgi:hypothetical protein
MLLKAIGLLVFLNMLLKRNRLSLRAALALRPIFSGFTSNRDRRRGESTLRNGGLKPPLPRHAPPPCAASGSQTARCGVNFYIPELLDSGVNLTSHF